MISSVLSERVAIVTISRAAKANSLPQAAKAALAAEIARWSSDKGADAIVITGEGERAFCSGSDVDEMHRFDMADMDRMLSDERAMYLSALRSSKPVVAAVNGFALGAGLILAMSCDYVVAAPKSQERLLICRGTPSRSKSSLCIGSSVPVNSRQLSARVNT